MPFQQAKLDRSVLQTRDIFNKYIYESELDTVAQVTANGYFSASRFASIDNDQTNGMGWRGGVIEARCLDGYIIGEVSSDGGTLTPLSVVSSSIDLQSHFKSIAERDDYFSQDENYNRLVDDDIIIVNVGQSGAFYSWSGMGNTSYDPIGWTQASVEVSPDSVDIGSRRESNGGQASQWENTGLGQQFVYIDDPIPQDDEQDAAPLTRDYHFAERVFDNQIFLSDIVSTPDPDGVTRYVVQNAASGRNVSLSGIPVYASTFIFELRLGSASMRPIFSQQVTFTESDAKVRVVTGITQAAQAVITFSEAHDYSVGDNAVIDKVMGMTEINNLPLDVVSITASTITVSTDTTLFSPYAGGGVGYTNVFTDLDNALTLRDIGTSIYASLEPVNGVPVALRGGNFGPLAPFIPYLRAVSRPIEEHTINTEVEFPKAVYVKSLPAQTTSSNYNSSPDVFLLSTFDIAHSGEYELSISFDGAASSTNRALIVGVYIDGLLVDSEFRRESKDSADVVWVTKVVDMSLNAGQHDIRVDYGKDGSGFFQSVTLQNFRISLRK